MRVLRERPGVALLAALAIVAATGVVLWAQLPPASRLELRRRAAP
jgi:hypothetical protein